MDYQQRIRCLALATVILGLVQVQQTLGASEVTVAPADVVARIGDNAQFFCKITGDPAKEAVAWKRRTYGSSKEEAIFDTFGPTPCDEAKYNCTKTAPLETNIVVKNLVMEDAGSYRCDPMSITSEGKTAELVVVENPVIAILDLLEDEKPGRITCDVYYLRSDDALGEALEPQLFASIGTQSLPINNVEKTAPTNGDQRFKLSYYYNGTMLGSQHGQNFTCGAKVLRQAPTLIDFTISVNKELQIKSPTTKAELSEPILEIYYPGDTINCTADGHPEPKMMWIPIKSEGAAEKSGCTLVITEQMMGNNTWKCRVNQYSNPPVVIETRQISFQVLSPTEPPTGKSSGANPTTIAVAVAVPIAVLLAVLIVVCIVCKKKKSGEAKPKRSEGVEAGTASQKQRNQIYKPVATNPEGQVRFQEDKASYKTNDSADKSGIPSPAPRQPEAAQATEETA